MDLKKLTKRQYSSLLTQAINQNENFNGGKIEFFTEEEEEHRALNDYERLKIEGKI